MRPKAALQTPLPGGCGTSDDLLKGFAAKNRLKLRVDNDESWIVPGRDGHIYQHDGRVLGVMFMPGETAKTADRWCNRRRAGIAAGMIVYQDGDREGTLHFSPTNKAGGKLALQIAGTKKKRVLSESQKELLTKRLDSLRRPVSSRAGGAT
jgi:hypothetical protein